MTHDDDTDVSGPSPDAVLEAAVRWHARLREPAPHPAAANERDRAFADWLAEHPDHRRAYEETKTLWNALAAPAARLANRTASGVPRTQRLLAPLRAAFSAIIVLGLVAGGLFHEDIRITMQSDYRTALGERRTAQLPDGSTITLNTATAVAVAERHVRLLRGEAWFDIAGNPDYPFTVETALGEVHVIGTRFGVRLANKTARVKLVEGELRLSAETEALVLSAGSGAELSDDGVSDPVRINTTSVTAWLRGQAVFVDTPLSEVVGELNRYRRIPIIIASDELAQWKISGVFSTDDPDAAVRALQSLLPTRVSRIAGYLVVLR